MTEQLYATFPGLEEHSSNSSSSPGSASSDESSGSSNEMSSETGLYEYAVCSGISCGFKFCVKCNCKYHPRQLCKEFAPASPSRNYSANKSVACSSQSLRSLKRLIYWFFFIEIKFISKRAASLFFMIYSTPRTSHSFLLYLILLF